MAELKKGISVVINTYNAEEHLAKVLETVADFDEILICDMESTDSTLQIAERFGCRVVSFPKKDNQIVEVARNFAIHQASYEWVLVVDADELITPELCKAVYDRVDDCEFNGYLIPRRNQFLGSYENSFRKDLQLRFFRQEYTEWKPIIHSKPVVEGEVGEIDSNNAVILHLQNRSISEFIRTYDIYTDYEVSKRLEQGRKYTALSLLFKPFFSTFKYYVFRGGYRDGMKGVLHASIIGMYDFFMIAKLLEYRINNKK